MTGALFLSLALAQAASSGCHAMARAVAEGDVVDAANTVAVPCGEPPRRRQLRYDRRAHVVRAQAALEEGEPIGRVFLPPRASVVPGERVALSMRLGHVSLSREAVALQTARPGRRYFVRGDDGTVFAAPPLAEEDRR